MKYSVHIYDSFSNEGCCIAKDLSLADAKKLADKEYGKTKPDMTLYEVYDENYVKVYSVGRY